MPWLRSVAVSLSCAALGVISCAGKSSREVGAQSAPPNPDCSLPQDPGSCLAGFPRYAYDAASGLCLPFIYGGCGGNANRFDSLAACRAACAAPSEPDSCTDNSQCLLAPTNCCSCNANNTSDVIALRSDAYAVFSAAHCATVDCACDGGQSISPYLVATCQSGRCTPIDLREAGATTCVESTQCQLRAGSQCCPSCNPRPSDWIVISDENLIESLVCGSAGPSCGLCVAIPSNLPLACFGTCAALPIP